MSKLYIVATPVGNLRDISLRALEVFKSVDVIVCEDTRVTVKLLAAYNIKKPLLSYHQQSKIKQVNKISELIKQGNNLALVSDAGTPGIQDPGNKLISELVSISYIEIIPIPGPSAVTTLASVSGVPTDSFLFLGYLPKKKGRQKALQEIKNSQRTVIFYESSHRILESLTELEKIIPDRQVVIGRELTKKHETIYRGQINQVIDQLKKTSTRGEFVVLAAPA